ncbi:TetR/AcrR family transcriptional regulator [Nonomuraea dietziae]|uniref:TetR/AcrR family transcriptional regulator n=1 Tax=Nonomuraea dietziae TaxID=65515 RepID=UPI0036217F2C
MTRELPIAGQPPAERADAARNRQRIIEVATRMVEANGAANLSLDEVAREANVGVGTVYRRFGDRSGLIYALIDAGERALQEAFMTGPPPIGPGAPPAERIRAFLHALVDRKVAQQELFVLLEMGSSKARFSGPYMVHHTHLATLLAEARPGRRPLPRRRPARAAERLPDRVPAGRARHERRADQVGPGRPAAPAVILTWPAARGFEPKNDARRGRTTEPPSRSWRATTRARPADGDEARIGRSARRAQEVLSGEVDGFAPGVPGVVHDDEVAADRERERQGATCLDLVGVGDEGAEHRAQELHALVVDTPQALRDGLVVAGPGPYREIDPVEAF